VRGSAEIEDHGFVTKNDLPLHPETHPRAAGRTVAIGWPRWLATGVARRHEVHLGAVRGATPVWVLSLIATETIAGAGSLRVWGIGMKRIGLGNAREAVTGRKLSGFRPLVAARPRLHSNRCYPRRGLGGENEPIFLDISDCGKTSSALGAKWTRTRSEAGPRRVQSATQAARHPGRDRSGLDRGVASHGRPDIGGENEPIILDISDCCETSSAPGAQWSRTRSEAGPRHLQATTQAGRHPGHDRLRGDRGPRSPRAARVRWRKRTQLSRSKRLLRNEFGVRTRWSRTRSEAVSRRVTDVTQARRHPGRDRSCLDRGIAFLVRQWLRGENEPIILDLSDCRETSSTSHARWSRTRSEACPNPSQPARHREVRHRIPDRSGLDRSLAAGDIPVQNDRIVRSNLLTSFAI
jgi:hypothetical protein